MNNTTPQNKFQIKGIAHLMKASFNEFSEHQVTKMSAALAYYTVFSMGPLLLLIISLSAAFFGRDAIEGEVYDQLSEFMGSETAAYIQGIISNAAVQESSRIAGIIGGVTLLFGATGVFAEIQSSINQIWGVKAKPKRGWLKILQNRFLSFSVIMSLVFILLVCLGLTTVMDGLNEQLRYVFSDVAVIVAYIVNQVITLLVITAIFSVIFKVLPDAEIRWKDVRSGAIATAILFMLGKFAISLYIGRSDVSSTYGAAGSIVVLLLWTYYSAIILYFGAAFTKAYACRYGEEIRPKDYAVTVRKVEMEDESPPSL